MRLSFDAILASSFVPAYFKVGKTDKHGPDISKSTTKEAEITAKLARLARLPATQVFNLESTWNPDGLSEEQAAEILSTHGLNIQVNERPLAALSMLWGALWNPFNVLLTILALINVATNSIPTFVVMIVMVVASTSLRYWQELKSMVQALKLVKSIVTRIRVIRRVNHVPQEIEIDLRHVVPGDIVAVASGDVFPGDCVVISSEALSVTQASLTGEILPIDKVARVTAVNESEPFHLLDNCNVCLGGTSVATGNGRAVVVSTGGDTYMAAIAEELKKKRPENAIQTGIRKVSYVLLAFMGVMAPAVFIVQGAVSKDWRGAVMFAIAVAVGITPEMLPMIVTSNLALSAVRIARQKVIVKRFDAIQNLGAVSVLCSDKTGTLTADLVRVAKSVNVKGEVVDLPVKLSFINSSLQTGSRSPIDRAILDYIGDDEKNSLSVAELDGWSKFGEVPFDSSRRMLSVLVSYQPEGGGEGLFITKGAVEEVLERCISILKSEEFSKPIRNITFESSTTLTAADRHEILDSAKLLNEDGFRLIAVACRKASVKAGMTISPEDEEDLVFIGFVALLDPLKPDAAEAIQRLGSLHVQVRILTGDVPAVAAKVARDLGLFNPVNLTNARTSRSPKDEEAGFDNLSGPVDESALIVTGPQLTELAKDRELLNETIDRAIIFAKLSPYQKLDVVKALRAGGGRRAVAFLGDGVNDALAIRGADVGISVDSGTEIAKEAADVILLEKSLGVVARGVVEGRITLLNTVKYIKMACSSNFGNVFSVLVASAWLPYQPMLPLQLLVQNLLYDFSQASIPWDNVDPEYLESPRAWSAWSIVRFMIFLGPFSSPFDIITFSINWFHYGIRTLDSPLVPLAQTNWFLEGSLTQLFIIQFLRTHKIPFIQSRASLSVVIVTFGMACVSMAIPYIPKINSALSMTPPEPMFYCYLLGMISGYALVVHIVKSFYLWLFKGEWL